VSNSLHPPLPRRIAGEFLAVALLGLLIASVLYANKSFPGPSPITKGSAILVYGMCFLFSSALLIGSYFLAAYSTVFRTISWLWERAPGLAGGRFGLLVLGALVALVGFCLVAVGSGIVG
jgi:hypothetical protein